MERKLEQARRKQEEAKVAELEAELAMPEFPGELIYLWRIFQRLRRRAGAGLNSLNPITFEAIDAFVRQTGFRLAPWEVEALEAIDDALLNPSARPAAPGESAREMVAVSDTQGVRSLLGKIGKRRSKKRGG